MKQVSRIIYSLGWGSEITRREEKEKIAICIADKVKDGQVIGAGSGSTAYLALLAIAQRITKEGLNVKTIPTSLEITMTCIRLGIPIADLNIYKPDWSFDGADEIDPWMNLIKGRGAAMFKEKLLMLSSPQTYILIDSSKRVTKLGSNFPVPVEIYPGALAFVEKQLNELPVREIALRMAAPGKDGPVVTENGNLILDVWFDDIPYDMEQKIKAIPGVIESGLFMGYSNIEVIDSDKVY